MARVNIYLPDELYDRVKGAGLASVSVICQAALRSAIGDATPIEVPPEPRKPPEDTGAPKKGLAPGRGPAPTKAPPPAKRLPKTHPAVDLMERLEDSLEKAKAQRPSEPCRHPVNRRIGTGCGACGAERVGAK